ncbi:MAG: hypothetical protein RLZZ11_895 [Cyanobacteriota bacterium]|jgi:CopG-like RHH_1 or ribbon-helix-helix domain, RHH_5
MMSNIVSSNQRQPEAAARSERWLDIARSTLQPGQADRRQRLEALRSPRRISITLPHHAFTYLVQRSNQEGRSLSNLAAFLLESAISENHTLMRS